tara:strand:- start:83 stop:475 length:393 start_codon:yes stop_codon:yes gene_type:complete
MKNKKWLLPLLFVSTLFGQIDIKPMKGYKVKGGIGGYSVKVSPTRQTLIKLEGTIPEKKGYHRVTWKTEKTFYWGNGVAVDVYPAVNPASYSKNGKVYTMVGLMPEMIGKTIVITATYGKDTDSIRLKIK